MPGPPKGSPRVGGRQKGTPNKLTTAVKETIEQVAQGLGGPDGMLAWAKEDPQNTRIFYGNIYPKLLPFTLAGDKDNPLKILNEVSFRSGVDNGNDTK